MKLFKSRSGSTNVFARLTIVEHVRKNKDPKDLVIYTELGGGWHLALARLFARWLSPFNLKAKSIGDFNDTFEEIPEVGIDEGDIDAGAPATLRTWESVQAQLSRRPEAVPEVREQPAAAPHETVVKGRAGWHQGPFVSMLRESGMLVSIRTPDKWGKDGPKVRDIFPSMHTIIDVQADDQVMLWCFNAGGTLLGVRPAEPRTDLQIFERRFATDKGYSKLSRYSNGLGEEFLKRWPTATVTLMAIGKKDVWVFDEDGKFLGVE